MASLQIDWCDDVPLVETYARKLQRGPVAEIPGKRFYTKAQHIITARMHLAQCQARRGGNNIQRRFRFTLLEWAAKRRLEAMACGQ